MACKGKTKQKIQYTCKQSIDNRKTERAFDMMSLELIFNGLIIIILYLASVEDMKYRRISKKYVIAIFVLVLIYINAFGLYNVEGTISFILTFIVFSVLVVVSKGGFGFGDTLIISAIGMYLSDLFELKKYFLIMAFTMMVWGAMLILYNRIKNKVPVKEQFKFVRTVNINDVKPGMVLANDYFMTGLTEKDIEKLKNDGYITLDVKQAYPFIPVILISFMVYTATLI